MYVCGCYFQIFELTYLCVRMNMRYGYCHCNIHVTMTTSTILRTVGILLHGNNNLLDNVVEL